MAQLKANVADSLKQQIDAVTATPEKTIPGVVYVAVNKDGKELLAHASGKMGLGREEPMTMESVFWIASCTKMITGIACMQLVEQGKLSLDDHESVYKLCPELRDMQVIDGKKLVPKQKEITLRMLLAHTAGFGYAFFDQRIVDFFGAENIDEFSGLKSEYYRQHLVNQPGSAWEYGINIDWAGQCVERASGMTLDEYFKKNIFEPMGLSHITFFPTDEMKSNLVYMHERDPHTGLLKLRPDGQLARAGLVAKTQVEKDAVYQAGGAGCFAQPREYAQILSMLCNNGKHAPSGAQILKKETVDQMFSNQIPEFPNFARQAINPAKPYYSNALPEMYPEPHEIPQGWGLTFFLHLKQSAVHSEGTGWWAGLPNLFWWCDRAKGLAGIISSQQVPFGDPNVLGLWGQIEGGLYQNLE